VTPLATPDCLIACMGDRMKSECRAAMEQVDEALPYLSIRFVDNEWLSPRELESAMLCWVIDAQLPRHYLYEALAAGLPLIVPAERTDLASLAEGSRCGFSYHTTQEAAERIVWFLQHPLERDALSGRARALSAGFRSAHGRRPITP
jgi:hypothetical protein